jgi:ribosomal protein S18 acetylase RimI-like enzyme
MRIRKYRKSDTKQVADLIVETFRKYNGREYYTKSAIRRYLDQYDTKKNSLEKLHAAFLRSVPFFVAEDGLRIVGMIRGSKNGIGNLFVLGSCHRRGIGEKLVKRFEKQVRKLKSKKLKVRSTIFATPFYQSMGFKKTTGIRNFRGHKMQPMKKDL